MKPWFLPIVFAVLFFLPVALFLAIIVLIGLKLGVVGEKDAQIAFLMGFALFLAMVIYFQGFSRKKRHGLPQNT